MHAIAARLRAVASPPPAPSAPSAPSASFASSASASASAPSPSRSRSPPPLPPSGEHTPHGPAALRHPHMHATDSPLDAAWAERLLDVARAPDAAPRCAAAGALLRALLDGRRRAACGWAW